MLLHHLLMLVLQLQLMQQAGAGRRLVELLCGVDGGAEQLPLLYLHVGVVGVDGGRMRCGLRLHCRH